MVWKTSNSSSIDTPKNCDKEKEVSSKSNKEYQYRFDDDMAEKKSLVALLHDSMAAINQFFDEREPISYHVFLW